MGHHGWGVGVLSGVLSGLFTLLLIALVILGVIALVRYLRNHSDHASGPGRRPTRAEQILAERFARGEIDEEEYRQRLGTLRGPPA